MKKCIWCLKEESVVPFEKKAHTIPQSLGGKNICSNVCDGCNSFFGQHHKGMPPIETVIKEAFNISRARFLEADGRIGKNKPMPKYTSIYFDVDFKKRKIELKSHYRFHNKGFQQKLSRQLKKGLYKIFLEELERQKGEALDEKYDFIREFARYDLGDYPVFYFERSLGAILMAKEFAESPELFMREEEKFGYLVNEPSFFEFELLGHVLSIATSRNWIIAFDNYKRKSFAAKQKYFKQMKIVKEFKDIDLTLSVLND